MKQMLRCLAVPCLVAILLATLALPACADYVIRQEINNGWAQAWGLGQSFTTPDAGSIQRIDVYFAGTNEWTSIDLRLYPGDQSPDDPGAALYTETFTGLPATGWASLALASPVPVHAGIQYTFELTPESALVTIGWAHADSYDGGTAWIAGWGPLPEDDLMFRVFVQSPGITTDVSAASDGTPGNGNSFEPSISADGRYVAFASSASNLVAGDLNDRIDVFVHDKLMGQTSLVSVASDGTQGNYTSYRPIISANGRFVAFDSDADTLVPDDTNGDFDIFVHDRVTSQTTRVSVASDGTEGNGYSDQPSVSGDGRYVAFASGSNNLVPDDTNTSWDIFVHDRALAETSRVSVASDGTEANQGSYWPSISSDGRYVAFQSNASNLVPDDTNNTRDVFVHDRVTGGTTCVSRASDGTQGTNISYQPIISADGRYVAFLSLATELVGGDNNGVSDAFVHDRITGQTERVSVASDGTQGNGETGVTSISADGRYVTFVSSATNLVPVDRNESADIFVHDRTTGETTRVSVASSGAEAQGDSDWRAISADGRYVAFHSDAANLVSGDSNESSDIFVRDRGQGEASREMAIPLAGGSMTSWDYDTTLEFPDQTFTDVVTVTHTSYLPGRHPLPGDLVDIGEFFDMSAAYSDTGMPADPTQPYTITVEYSDPERGTAIEDTLALYYWDGDEWVRETSSSVNPAEGAVVATPQHFSSWAVLGETKRVYLPLVLRSY